MSRNATWVTWLLLGALALAGLVVACSSSTPGAAPTRPSEPVTVLNPGPSGQGPTFPSIPIPPDSDLYALAESLKVKSGAPILHLSTDVSAERHVGDVRSFWVLDLDAMRAYRVTAELRYISAHLYMYVDEAVGTNEDDLARAASEFEEVILPGIVSRFGNVFVADDGGAERLTVLNANIPAVLGYYNPDDLYPEAVRPYSNQGRTLYMNISALRPGFEAYSRTLAHELQHAAHDNADPSEEVWVNEGLSALAEEIIGPNPDWPRFFMAQPDTQLTGWPLGMGDSGPDYGAAYLFMAYLQEHYGDPAHEGSLKDLVSQAADGIEGINAYLKAQGYATDFDGVFKDWVIANFLDGQGQERYGYEGRDVHLSPTRVVTDYTTIEDSVSQYAADYIRVSLKDDGARIVFQGFPFAKLLPNDAHSGRWQWWSNRGDGIDSTLTREVDLSGIHRATLTFWAWYDIEEGFDHAYVEASVDGGATWDILQGRGSSPENTLGTSFGFSYTGVSGGGSTPRWTPESIDLSAYAGRKVLLRFQYITDDAVNGPGLAVDDISIPEIGFIDDVEEEGRWEARGFYRTDNSLPQRFFVQAILLGDGTRVLEVPLSSRQRGEVLVPRFGERVRSVVLVVAAATPVTSERARYQVSVEPLPSE